MSDFKFEPEYFEQLMCFMLADPESHDVAKKQCIQLTDHANAKLEAWLDAAIDVVALDYNVYTKDVYIWSTIHKPTSHTAKLVQIKTISRATEGSDSE